MLIRIENITIYASVIIFLYRIDTLTHLLVIDSVTVIDSHRLSFISQRLLVNRFPIRTSYR